MLLLGSPQFLSTFISNLTVAGDAFTGTVLVLGCGCFHLFLVMFNSCFGPLWASVALTGLQFVVVDYSGFALFRFLDQVI